MLYDADGAGGAAAVQFATMTPGLALTAAHFNVTGAPQPAAVQQSVGSTGFKAQRYAEDSSDAPVGIDPPLCADDACLPCTDYFWG